MVLARKPASYSVLWGNTDLHNKAKQSKAKEVFDESAGRSLYTLQITQNIIYTNSILSVNIINETSTSYSG